ncbi:pentatricopeptide repeat-containing protein At5g62370 isoform X1 [Cucurbita maxima]|uniref:Pentatricopeptide repeat-containing protein At5g62370 isoform X1 n=1 Tax=Cucurbita maxima TaxID=3661 RepID=A0A6J1J4Z3_CUCMA|nr:pentatricopeptide repeat-containing protein At5g62370 isoform X1 [Cucurbita maxima]XP_022985468.1 pentatricopeptide repeat-containing protein At5g62370 isoform X1 [Cucurbita maxima]
MIRGRPCKYYLSVNFRNLVTTCTVPLDPPVTSSSSSASEHKTLCYSLVDQLIRRGLFLPAQQVIQRIVTQSSSISEAISIVDFAAERGLELDLATHGVLCRQLVYSRPQLAELLYDKKFTFGGAEPDASVLDSMVTCFCRLGKFEKALAYFNQLLSLNYVPSKSSFNAIFRELCAQERVLEAFDYFMRVNGAGVHLGYWCFNVLIDGLCNKGHMEEALELFDIMQSTNGYPPSLHLFKSLFYGLCKSKWLVEAELLIREMEFRSLHPDKTMYTSLVHEYCKDKKMKMAMQAFFRMIKIGCEPDNYTLNTLIHGFVKLGLVDKGWLVYNLMAEWGIQPDVVTFHIMISQYCQEGKVDFALTILNNMVSCNISPSLHCYTVLINALHRDDRLEEVSELLKSMLDNGIIPDHVLFFTLMKMYPKGHELQLALNVLEAILKNGCGCDPSVILASTKLQTSSNLEQKIETLLQEIFNSNLNLAGVAFSIVICALCETENLDCALDYFHKMASLGCKPLLFTYNSLIKCLCKEGLFEDALSLIDHMQEFSLLPDTTTYLIIVNEYCRKGNVQAAYYILRKMRQRGLKPSVAIYDSIIGCLSRKKRIFEAEGVFKMMLEAGVDPDKNLYLTMINGYGENGKLLEARELFEQMVENSIPPSSHIYTALISGLVKRNMTDRGCLYLGKMLRDGFSPNAVLYTSLINHYLKIGEVEYAFRLVDLMERSHIEPDVIFYITLVSGICKNLIVDKKKWFLLEKENQKAKSTLFHMLHETTLVPRDNNMIVSANSTEEMKSLALKLIQKVKDVCIVPNLHLYNSIICGYCRTDRMLDANHQLELMQKEGLHPNQVTFTILMDGHILAGDVNSAIGLFNKMNVDGCIPDKVAYNTLLKGLSQGGRLSDALALSHTMHKKGFPQVY